MDWLNINFLENLWIGLYPSFSPCLENFSKFFFLTRFYASWVLSSRRSKTELSLCGFRINCLKSESCFLSVSFSFLRWSFSSFNFWTSAFGIRIAMRVTGTVLTGMVANDVVLGGELESELSLISSGLVLFCCWLLFWSEGDRLRTLVAGGRYCGTETVAAKVEARARSQDVGLADFSEPLPGILTNDLTRLPTWWGATIIVGVTSKRLIG